MKIKVNKDTCTILQDETWNVGDYNVHIVEVELSDEFSGLVNKVRYFVGSNCYDMLIEENIAQIPAEATEQEGFIEIGVYGFETDTDVLVQSTMPIQKYVFKGTYTGDAENVEPLTPTDKEQMQVAIQANTNSINNLINTKQDKLVSGETIKTINNQSLLGEGNIDIQGGSGTGNYPDLENLPSINNVTLLGNKSLNDLGIQAKGNYALTSDIPTQLSQLSQDSTHRVVTDTEKTTWSGKQNTSDNSLETTDKTIAGAINEVNNIAKGANQALSYSNYQTMVTAFNALDKDEYNTGQNVYVITTEVPDLWVSSVETTSSTYTYVDDATIVNALSTNGYIQVGYYKLSMLETQKVDLTGYQTKIDSSHKLNSDLVSDTNQTNKFVTTSEKSTWNAKYEKPSGGIPSTDLASAVQTSLGKADTAIQDISTLVPKTTTIAGVDLQDNITKSEMQTALGVSDMVTLTQAQYDALISGGTVDPNTYYFIEEE